MPTTLGVIAVAGGCSREDSAKRGNSVAVACGFANEALLDK